MVPQGADSLIGVKILNQYQLVSQLATGGMSKVYLADQLSMDRQAAVKIVCAQHLHGQDWDLRFKREARTASRLQHPNIVTVFNFGQLDDGSLFLAMEYVKGVRLASILRRGALPLSRAVHIAKQAVVALQYAHESGVVHRDLKPDNIMLTELSGRDHVKILDFGIARVIGEGTLTAHGALLGTPRYMSPEQTRGEIATALSDQYALGLLLYEMLTGQPAISSDSPMGFLNAHQVQIPPPPSSVSAGAELERLDPIVGRMLAKRPADRYADMTQVQIALEERLAEFVGQTSGAAETLPLCRGVVDDDENSVSGLPMAKTESLSRQGEQAAVRIGVVGPAHLALSSAAKNALGRRGFQINDSAREDADADLWLLGNNWPPTPVPAQDGPNRGATLHLVDLPLDGLAYDEDPSDAIPANLLLGAAPHEPAVLSLALNWLYRGPRSVNVGLLDRQEVRSLPVTSSARRSIQVEQLVQDAKRHGVRQAAQQALAELCEELLANALFHAPVDEAGRARMEGAERSDDLVLPPEEAPTLSWALLNRYIAVSVSDPFGSLARRQLIASILGSWPARSRQTVSGLMGAGLGLRVAARAARHLICATIPGTVTEILGLVPKEAQAGPSSLCVLEVALLRTRLGRNLWLKETVEGTVTQLRLVGEVIDVTDLSPVFRYDGEVWLDLSGVTRFNSHGIHLWLQAMKGRPAGQRLVLERCSLAVLNQINSVPNMTKGVELRSVLAPYYCDICGRDCLEVVTTDEAQACLPPRRSCICGAPLTFDGLAEHHFAFLETAPEGVA